MNLLDPNCGLDPEERREILLHTDAGRAVIAAEDAEMSRAVHFAEGLPPGWSVGAYVKGPKKGSPCLIKGVRGQPGGVQVKPIPEGYEPDQEGGLRRKGRGDITQASPAATQAEPPHPLAAFPDNHSKFRRLASLAENERMRDRSGQPFTDPLGVYRPSPPAGLNAQSFSDDLIGTAARHNLNYGAPPLLQELYETVGREHGLTKHAFLRAVGSLHGQNQDGPMKLRANNVGLGELEQSGYDPELLMIDARGGLIVRPRLSGEDRRDQLQQLAARGNQSLETHSPRLDREHASTATPVAPTQPSPLTPTATTGHIDRWVPRVDTATQVIGSLMAGALSIRTRGDKVRVRNTINSHLRNLSRTEIDQVAAHVGVTRKLPNKRAVLDAIADRIIEQNGAYARGTE